MKPLESHGNGSTDRFRSGLTGAIAVLPALALMTMGYHRRWLADDGFIYLRVVRQLLAGHGPVFNPGERVEAYTGPLWVALLAAWSALGGPLETGVVMIGLLFSLGGLIAAQAGAARLARRLDAGGTSDRPGRMLPLGAAVFVALPPVWDFATSGLETGLIFGWLGVSFWLLVRLCASDKPLPSSSRGVRSGERRSWIVAAFVLGLGPLVRPDLAIFSGGFLAVLLVGYGSARGRRAGLVGGTGLLLAAGFIPVAYQVFRMGYFAALVPNTALAKEAGATHWSQGWRYAQDFAGPYALWIPVLPLVCWWAVSVGRVWPRREPAVAMVLLVPVLAAAIHAAFVIRVGGDFMHGRMLLPGLFGMLLPVAAVIVPMAGTRSGRLLATGAAVLVVSWAIACARWLRVPYAGEVGPTGIADERGYYAQEAGQANPITVSDYAEFDWTRDGLALHAQAEENPRVLRLDGGGSRRGVRVREIPLALVVRADITLVVARRNIGLLGYVAGSRVHVIDRHGLADPIAARLRLTVRDRPGHEKLLPEAWDIARFVSPHPADAPAVRAAHQALACGNLRALQEAVRDPLTVQRFLTNLRMAPRLHRLRVPANPHAARREACRETSAAAPGATPRSALPWTS
ncbi:MAG: hypothetical protein M3R02_05870 [Chloroflexota bacterium]|nr:hypothetical protein [Chloroflexota bacterium]